MDNIMITKTNVIEGEVVQHNALIQSCHAMTLTELRILRVFIAGLHHKGENEEDSTFVIKLDEYNEIYGIKEPIKTVRAAARRLVRRTVLLREEYTDGKGNKYKEDEFSIVERCRYGDAAILIQFTKSGLGLLQKLENNFTRMPLKALAQLNSSYGVRFLELLVQRLRFGGRTMTIKEIRETFELENKYKITAELRRVVIDAAMKDINKNTDYKVSATAKKVGVKIVSFEFKIKAKVKSKKEKLEDFLAKGKTLFGGDNKITIGGETVHNVGKDEEGQWLAMCRYDNKPLLPMLEQYDFEYVRINAMGEAIKPWNKWGKK